MAPDRLRDPRGRYVKAGLVRYVNAKGKESFVSPTEKARREGISRFARDRFRQEGGTFEVRRFRVTVAGWSTVSREGPGKGARRRGWDYHDEERTFIVDSSLDDEDYLRNLLDEQTPSRRHWDVLEVEPVDT